MADLLLQGTEAAVHGALRYRSIQLLVHPKGPGDMGLQRLFCAPKRLLHAPCRNATPWLLEWRSM